MNFSTFVYDERQCNRNRDRENLRDFPMRIVGAVTICFVDGVGIDLCAAVRFREPAEERKKELKNLVKLLMYREM